MVDWTGQGTVQVASWRSITQHETRGLPVRHVKLVHHRCGVCATGVSPPRRPASHRASAGSSQHQVDVEPDGQQYADQDDIDDIVPGRADLRREGRGDAASQGWPNRPGSRPRLVRVAAPSPKANPRPCAGGEAMLACARAGGVEEGLARGAAMPAARAVLVGGPVRAPPAPLPRPGLLEPCDPPSAPSCVPWSPSP